MKLYYKVKQTKTNLQKCFHPSSTNLYMRTGNAESQNMSAKGSHFKDEDGAHCFGPLGQPMMCLPGPAG